MSVGAAEREEEDPGLDYGSANPPKQQLPPELVERICSGRELVESIRSVVHSTELVTAVLHLLAKLVRSPDVDVRFMILRNIPLVALELSDSSNVPDNSASTTGDAFRTLISTHILPIVVTALLDKQRLVVSYAERAVIALLEHSLITDQSVKQHVWPALLRRRPPSNDQYENTISLISMISMMIPWVSGELSESLFVPEFSAWCGSDNAVVRQVCATVIGEFCAVVSLNTVELSLVPWFTNLCDDSDISVRKKCTEVFMSVSSACSSYTRKKSLTPVFSKLIIDAEVEVRIAAFKSLGPFITTFAEPSITNLSYNNQGELVLRHSDGFEFKLLRFGKSVDSMLILNPSPGYQEPSDCFDDDRLDERVEEDQDYTDLCFWRFPIPDLPLDDNVGLVPIPEEPEDSFSSSSECHRLQVGGSGKSEKLSSQEEDLKPLSKLMVRLYQLGVDDDDEEVVPPELVQHFVTMSGCFSNLQLQEEAHHHCAFSLPAVALTLGPRRWSLLRFAYQSLANDKTWKVRRILASSIHELAVILGEDLATKDLVPTYNDFIKDLDEVRIGALTHLANFLKAIKPSGHKCFLPHLKEFLRTDYVWKWRFRAELGEQLLQVLELFSPQDVSEYVAPVAMALLQDKVAEVRNTAIHLMGEVMNSIRRESQLVRKAIADVAEKLSHSCNWLKRQTFALLCAHLVHSRAVTEAVFARDLLPHLLDLSGDSVPNVKLAVARTLSHTVMALDYFSNPCSPHYEVLMTILKQLSADEDRDVRSLARVPWKTQQKQWVDQDDHLRLTEEEWKSGEMEML